VVQIVAYKHSLLELLLTLTLGKFNAAYASIPY